MQTKNQLSLPYLIRDHQVYWWSARGTPVTVFVLANTQWWKTYTNEVGLWKYRWHPLSTSSWWKYIWLFINLNRNCKASVYLSIHPPLQLGWISTLIALVKLNWNTIHLWYEILILRSNTFICWKCKEQIGSKVIEVIERLFNELQEIHCCATISDYKYYHHDHFLLVGWTQLYISQIENDINKWITSHKNQ